MGEEHLNWGDYTSYVPPYPGPLRDLTKRQARISFDDLMQHKGERVAALEKLAVSNGCPLDGSRESLSRFERWLCSNVESDLTDPGRMAPIWYAVGLDTGLYLGDLYIQKHPNVRWEIGGGGKMRMGFQSHVLAGFSAVPDPGFIYDLDGTIMRYLVSVATGNAKCEDNFTAILDSLSELA